MKIFICGPSGTGKTTMAKWISQQYGIPYVNLSGRSIWDKFDIKNHEDLIKRCAKDPKFGMKYQYALLKQRGKAIKENPSMVTERSCIDNLVYFLIEVAPHISYRETLDYVEAVKEQAGYMDGLIMLRYNKDMPVENDGARIANPVFQECSQLYFDYALDKWFDDSRLYLWDLLSIHTADYDVRRATVSAYINNLVAVSNG